MEMDSNIRAEVHYGGTLDLIETEPGEYVLAWEAYSGGGVRLELHDKELARLRDLADGFLKTLPERAPWLVD